MDSLSLFDYILLAMGVYVLVAGIRGKGRLYNVENIKEGMEETYFKAMRKIYIGLGVVMTLNGVFSVLKYVFYSYEEIIPATETMTAGYDWVAKGDMGFWSFLTIPFLNVMTYVCMGISIAVIVLMIIITRKMTDKEAAAKRAQAYKESAASSKQAGHILPVSAFDFEEEGEAQTTLPEAAEQDAQEP